MTFPLAGNDRLKALLDSFINTDRFPHAIIIEGERGVGKHTLADYLIHAAVCTGENRPCGKCDSCHLADAGSHPDITVVAPDNGRKNIAVDQIRLLRQNAYVKAHISDKRVFLIDKAETMNAQSQNALLKVLEEPPAGVIFILISLSRTDLLETIVSRCVTLSPAVPERKEAAEYIRSQLDASPEDINRALNEASGRIGRALELLRNSDSGKASAAAAEIVSLLTEGNEWKILKLLAPFEKDRAGTDSLFYALKEETVSEIRKCRKNSVRARVLSKFYDQICSYDYLLKTNISLPLLFSAMVSRITMINNE